MIDRDTCAAADFYRRVRRFAESATGWQSNVIFHEITPDETRDFTLVSRRVYGRRDEYLAVMAAAGVDMIDQELPAGEVIRLPNEEMLLRIKRETNFESQSDLRENFEPIWKDA